MAVYFFTDRVNDLFNRMGMDDENPRSNINSKDIYNLSEALSLHIYKHNNIARFTDHNEGKEKIDINGYLAEIDHSDPAKLQLNIQTFLLQKIIAYQLSGINKKHPGLNSRGQLEELYAIWSKENFWNTICENVEANAEAIAGEIRQTIAARKNTGDEKMWMRLFAIDELANELKLDGKTKLSPEVLKSNADIKAEAMEKDVIFSAIAKSEIGKMMDDEKYEGESTLTGMSRKAASKISYIDKIYVGLENNKKYLKEKLNLHSLGDEYRDCEMQLLATNDPKVNYDRYLRTCVERAFQKESGAEIASELTAFAKEADSMYKALDDVDPALMISHSPFGQLKKDLAAYKDYTKKLEKLAGKGQLDASNLNPEQMENIASLMDKIEQHANDYLQYKTHHRKGTKIENDRIQAVFKVYTDIMGKRKQMFKYAMKKGIENAQNSAKEAYDKNTSNPDNHTILENQIQAEVLRNVRCLTAILGKGFSENPQSGMSNELSAADKETARDCATKLLLCSLANQELNYARSDGFSLSERDHDCIFGEHRDWFDINTAMRSDIAKSAQMREIISDDLNLNSIRNIVSGSGNMAKELKALEARVMEAQNSRKR